ncbi:MAG: Trk system potassium transporter TrkA [Spirochaetaceae bacterium]|jgi:trk system potassium uptake protein TrkA|nr:Trk system potassium transporter TrkA [Spirochaetaceae bacterium]
MRIVVIGAGSVGIQLCRHLIREKHDVSLIESDPECARHASNRLDCLVIQDEGNNLSALEEAGIAKAQALVCATDSDEINMLICGLAASRYPDLLKIARVRNDDYLRLNRREERILGIDHFVHPDVEAARWVLNAVEHGALGEVLAFPGTPYGIGAIDVAPNSLFDGLKLTDFRSAAPPDSLVTLVDRAGKSILPGGGTVLTPGDRVHILAKEAELASIFELAGQSHQKLKNIGIVGGGKVGILIAEGLINREHSFLKKFFRKKSREVTIIEQDYALCKDLAARFPEALILNEDISDERFSGEERIFGLDLIVTATGHQELNIITGAYLKSKGVRRAIALVSGAGYGPIARQLGIDVVIPTKLVIVDSILSHLMGSGVKGVHRIGDGRIGILEIEIGPDTPLLDKPITAFRLSAGGLIMLVNRGGESFIPKGGYVFQKGDHCILIAKNGSEKEIEKLLF